MQVPRGLKLTPGAERNDERMRALLQYRQLLGRERDTGGGQNGATRGERPQSEVGGITPCTLNLDKIRQFRVTHATQACVTTLKLSPRSLSRKRSSRPKALDWSQRAGLCRTSTCIKRRAATAAVSRMEITTRHATERKTPGEQLRALVFACHSQSPYAAPVLSP